MRLKNVIELQIKEGFEDYSKIVFFCFNENICCDPLIESSR